MGQETNTTTASESLLHRVEAALNSIRPYLEADGGNIEIVEITADQRLKLQFLGNCAGCTLSSMTFRAGVEEAVKRLVPEITAVESIN